LLLPVAVLTKEDQNCNSSELQINPRIATPKNCKRWNCNSAIPLPQNSLTPINLSLPLVAGHREARWQRGDFGGGGSMLESAAEARRRRWQCGVGGVGMASVEAAAAAAAAAARHEIEPCAAWVKNVQMFYLHDRLSQKCHPGHFLSLVDMVALRPHAALRP
jgi:hypothetical protein